MTTATVPTGTEETLAALLSRFPAANRRLVECAMRMAERVHAGQRRRDGSPAVAHAMAVAAILAEWGADAETIAAGVLHDALEDTSLSLREIRDACGDVVATLVEGVTKFTHADFALEERLERKVETLRKLFEVMRRDIRVIIIKLADRLHNCRTMDALSPERRLRFARETLDVYYHLSHHLGMNELRRELSELCMPVLHPEETLEMRAVREAAMREGEDVCSRMERAIRERDASGALRAISPAVRSFYSMGREHDRIGHIRNGYVAIVIARDLDACYDLLKLLHTLYRPISGEFHDYIAAPTESAYQSIRTAVVGPGVGAVFLRIRTDAMHRQERLGVLLKCFGDRRDVPGFSWLAHSENLDRATRESSEAFWEAIQSDVFQRAMTVVVDGREVHLPQSATALDALYARHGERAHSVQSVKLNGVAAALGDVLGEDAIVQVQFARQQKVVFDWLECVETRYARNLIIGALKRRDRNEKVVLGRRLLQRELDQYRKGMFGDIPRARLKDVTERFRRRTFEEVLALIGEGVVRASDAVFHLYPEQQRIPFLRWRRAAPAYRFRLKVTGAQKTMRDVLPALHSIVRTGVAEIVKTVLSPHPKRSTFDLFIIGRAPDRFHFADFLAALDRQNWVTEVRVLMSRQQWGFLSGSFLLAFLVVVTDIVLLPQYHRWFQTMPDVPRLLLQVFPLLPILVVNYELVRLLRHHLAWLRTDRWFLGVAFLLNMAGLFLIVARVVFAGGVGQSLLPLLAVFAFSMLYLGYRFFQTETLFAELEHHRVRPMSEEAWRIARRKKFVGYAIRLCAVLIWGLEPIYIRYTAANSISPFLRTFLLSAGVMVPCGALFLAKELMRERRLPRFRLPYDRYFLFLIVGQTGLMYFKNASLVYTSGTNFLLFSSFAPVIGLLAAALFQRGHIPYLKQPVHMLWIFLLAVTSGIGSTLLLLNSAAGSPHAIMGDVLAMFAVFFDVLMTIGQIEYIRLRTRTDGLLLNLHIFFFLLLFTAPAILVLHGLGFPILHHLTWTSLLLGMGIGLFVGFGQLLNYEAFKRIDGYLAFMLFNLSVLISFALEVSVIRSVLPTFLLFLSATLIIGASSVAEWVNSHCERRGL